MSFIRAMVLLGYLYCMQWVCKAIFQMWFTYLHVCCTIQV